MNICIDLTSLYDKLSGIEKFTMMISKNMIQNDNKNRYILIFWNEIHEEFNNIVNKENVEYKIIKSKNKLVMSQIILPLQLYKIKADKYLFMAFPSPIFFRNKNIINTIHDMTPWLYPETMSIKGLILFKTLIFNAIKISKSIITVSNSSKNDILKIFKSNIQIDVIYNGVDEVFTKFEYNENVSIDVKRKYSLPEDYILALGTLEPRKNFKLLLKAFVELKRENLIKDKLVIVGRKGWKYDGILNGIEKDILEDIFFTGFVETNELPYIYRGASLFVLPSIYEGFGIPAIEASSMECIVLTSDIEVFKEILQDKAVYFKSNNVLDLKQKILQIKEFDERDKMKVKMELVENSKKYNWTNEALKLLNVIEEKK